MRIRSPSAPSRDERRTRVASLRHRTARWTHVQQQQLLLHVTNDKRGPRGVCTREGSARVDVLVFVALDADRSRSNSETWKDGRLAWLYSTWHMAHGAAVCTVTETARPWVLGSGSWALGAHGSNGLG